MLLYIVRHGPAGQHGDPHYPDDALRPLTKKGQKQFRRLVKKLARRGFAPAIVGTSPLVRCRQTAVAICQRVAPPPELTDLDCLRPGSDLDALIAWSNDHEVGELAWVGHAPDVDRLAAALIGGREGGIVFAKGAVAAINFENEIAVGVGELRWLVTPKALGC
jgi:phosphohistidine phosphatase